MPETKIQEIKIESLTEINDKVFFDGKAFVATEDAELLGMSKNEPPKKPDYSKMNKSQLTNAATEKGIRLEESMTNAQIAELLFAAD